MYFCRVMKVQKSILKSQQILIEIRIFLYFGFNFLDFCWFFNGDFLVLHNCSGELILRDRYQIYQAKLKLRKVDTKWRYRIFDLGVPLVARWASRSKIGIRISGTFSPICMKGSCHQQKIIRYSQRARVPGGEIGGSMEILALLPKTMANCN